MRFGAYHIYVPPLLKPAPRALATQLFALKHEGPELKGLEEVQQLAASGRTSIPVDKDIPKILYRAAGYRVCGERAVRVDILERLADLIRPALAWRDNAPGVKPPGALDGTGFTVTVGMTSLVGSSGEDFASILRALGYRMDRRPKPAEASPPAEAVAPAPPKQRRRPRRRLHRMSLQPKARQSKPRPNLLNRDGVARQPEFVARSCSGSAAVDRISSDGPVEAPAPEAAPSIAGRAGERRCADRTIIRAVEAAPVAETAAAPAGEEPQFIEVWRPGRFEHRERRRPQARPPPGPPPARGRPGRTGRGARRCRRRRSATGRERGPGRRSDAPRREHRRPRRPHRGERRDRPERQEGERPAHHGKRRRDHDEKRERPERRERQPDPNSPFAKLAALKAQLEADSKERR